jgi:dihydrofolate synthase/folylpolyglutamate synthase
VSASRSLSPSLAALYARAPRGIELGLGPIREACAKMGHPERGPIIAHVAGTNGKGSVSAMLERIARQGGFRTGLYTSPHLCRFAERIRIDGEPVSDAILEDVIGRSLSLEPKLTFFEAATLAAFLAFREQGATVTIVEVGLGGRLDATNVIEEPTVSVITRIDFDHMDRLGYTLAEIAAEKAGIAKRGVPLVVGDVDLASRNAIIATATRAGAELVFAMEDEEAEKLSSRATLKLAGQHQLRNARIAACAARAMGASEEAVVSGLSLTEWPGRLETVVARGRRFLLDAAHNPDGARSLATHLASLSHEAHGTHADVLIFGALADKAWPAMLPILAEHARARVYVTPQGRAPAPPSELSRIASGQEAVSVEDALARAAALSPENGLIVVSGSMYLVGEIRAALLGLPRDPAVAL